LLLTNTAAATDDVSTATVLLYVAAPVFWSSRVGMTTSI
jgi:hypothetical protein